MVTNNGNEKGAAVGFKVEFEKFTLVEAKIHEVLCVLLEISSRWNI